MPALPPEKKHFITYGDDLYKNAKSRIKKQAERFGAFDTITVYGPENIDTDFKKRFTHILSKSRGGGYWIWKPYFVNKRFQEIKDGEYLIYLDAGVTINKKGKPRFRYYISRLRGSDKGFISFKLPFREKEWSASEVFNYFKIKLDSKLANSYQYVGGVLIIKKNKNSSTIIEKWLKALYDDPRLFTDHYNRSRLNKNRTKFKSNRHDQSSLSLLRKIYGSISLGQETRCKNRFPFWSTRKKN